MGMMGAYDCVRKKEREEKKKRERRSIAEINTQAMLSSQAKKKPKVRSPSWHW